MPTPRVLLHAPAELTAGRLRRLGEGIGKVVYASERWVVKRPRSPSEVVALILIWKLIPRRFLQRPSRLLRLLRVCVQAVMGVVPSSVWLSAHVKDVWRIYRSRDRRGERLAQTHLAGTPLVPEVITFPPIRVDIGGWPGWLTVSEATAYSEAKRSTFRSDCDQDSEGMAIMIPRGSRSVFGFRIGILIGMRLE